MGSAPKGDMSKTTHSFKIFLKSIDVPSDQNRGNALQYNNIMKGHNVVGKD